MMLITAAAAVAAAAIAQMQRVKHLVAEHPQSQLFYPI
jgi:hypothetical protein